jgi:hypothetical protein
VCVPCAYLLWDEHTRRVPAEKQLAQGRGSRLPKIEGGILEVRVTPELRLELHSDARAAATPEHGVGVCEYDSATWIAVLVSVTRHQEFSATVTGFQLAYLDDRQQEHITLALQDASLLYLEPEWFDTSKPSPLRCLQAVLSSESTALKRGLEQTGWLLFQVDEPCPDESEVKKWSGFSLTLRDALGGVHEIGFAPSATVDLGGLGLCGAD